MTERVKRDGGSAFCRVNPHYLENIVRLSDGVDIRANNDIVDDSGMTLWPQGRRVSRDLHIRLQRRCLRQPLEASLDAEASTSAETVWQDALALMAQSPTLEALGGAAGTHGLLRALRNQRLPSSVSLLLTSARTDKRHSYDTSLAATIVAAGLGFACGLTDHDTMRLMLAALVHDIGEIYINPAYLDPTRQLQPSEWKYVASHPCVGQAFLREFTDFPSAITDCVLHHHERQDGSGYPFSMPGKQLGLLDKLICVADTVAAIVVRGGQGVERRVLAALRLFPNEFPPPAVTFITRCLSAGGDMSGATTIASAETMTLVLNQIESARRETDAIIHAEKGAVPTQECRHAADVLFRIEQRLRTSGVRATSGPASSVRDDADTAGQGLMLDEVRWRLRSLARSLYLHTEHYGSSQDLEAMTGLVAALDPASSIPS